jgi:hypothetical protein
MTAPRPSPPNPDDVSSTGLVTPPTGEGGEETGGYSQESDEDAVFAIYRVAKGVKGTIHVKRSSS